RLRGVGAVEVGLREEDAGHQQRGVDGRQLDVLKPLGGLHVEEVVEETLVSRDAARRGALLHRQQRAQGGEGPLRGLPTRHVAALGADAVGREAEAHGGDARERGRRRAVGNQQRARIGEVPEVLKAAMLHVVQQRIVAVNRDGFSDWSRSDWTWCDGGRSAAAREKQGGQKEEDVSRLFQSHYFLIFPGSV